MQGARNAATETYRIDRRGSKNEVLAKAHIGAADVKRSGRSQHRATQRFARAVNYLAFPYSSVPTLIEQNQLVGIFWLSGPGRLRGILVNK